MEKNPKLARQKYDANTRIPETLTSFLRDSLAQLPSGPKEDYLRAECFSKFVSKDTAPPEERYSRAVDKWLATEKINEATNSRLIFTHEEYQILPRVSWARFRNTVQSIITDVIGEYPLWDDLFGGFSGGATTSRQRTSSHPAEKYLGKADVTARAYEIISDLIADSPVWSELIRDCEITTVEGGYLRLVGANVLFTVPKNAEIDRCACKEPDLNMYLQRGLGNQIRKSLKRVGIDLNDQSRNRELAQRGSADGSLATLDLSSASDSISYELVAQFLPELWFTFLDASRSEKTLIDGEVHVNEMFSSMGNGFTFELESLLFYAISRATAYLTNTRGTISVYGDDIIVPSDLSADLIWVLGYCGFTVNTKKSFTSGPFRESCGGHYYNGVDITPFYVKKPLVELVDLIHVCNQLREWGARGGHDIIDPSVEELWYTLARHVPSRFWGGHDTGFKGQLVSYWKPDRPYRLVSRSRPRALPEGGKYLLWLDNGRTRQHGVTDKVIAGVLTSSEYRAVKARWFVPRGLVPSFPREVMAEYGSSEMRA